MHANIVVHYQHCIARAMTEMDKLGNTELQPFCVSFLYIMSYLSNLNHQLSVQRKSIHFTRDDSIVTFVILNYISKY